MGMQFPVWRVTHFIGTCVFEAYTICFVIELRDQCNKSRKGVDFIKIISNSIIDEIILLYLCYAQKLVAIFAMPMPKKLKV